MAVVAFVPPAIVKVSPGVIPVEPESPATVVSETAKSIVPSESWYVTVIPVSVFELTMAPTLSWTSSSVSVAVI